MNSLEIYLVGGAVRDKLLGFPTTEKDYVVVGASPMDLLSRGFTPVGKDFPVFLHPETKEEYALARTERKTAPGYHGFEFYASKEVTLEEDLARRDLTINAMALGPDGSLIDPYGGLADLENKVLRHVSASFVEDPIRVLRLARFAARYKHLGFKIAPETLQLAQTLRRAGELNALTPERVWQETWKALGEKDPAEYFEVLKACGGLSILFPELEALFGVPGLIQSKHYMDAGAHALLSLTNAAKLSHLPEVRFAALTHGIGKALTSPKEWPSHKGYTELSEAALDPLFERYKIPKHVKDLAKVVAKYHLLWEAAITPEAILEFYDACDALRRPERFANILLVCEACLVTQDHPGHSEFLLKTLSALQDRLKGVKPATVTAGKAMKNIYRQAKLDALKKILQAQKAAR